MWSTKYFTQKYRLRSLFSPTLSRARELILVTLSPVVITAVLMIGTGGVTLTWLTRVQRVWHKLINLRELLKFFNSHHHICQHTSLTDCSLQRKYVKKFSDKNKIVYPFPHLHTRGREARLKSKSWINISKLWQKQKVSLT